MSLLEASFQAKLFGFVVKLLQPVSVSSCCCDVRAGEVHY